MTKTASPKPAIQDVDHTVLVFAMYDVLVREGEDGHLKHIENAARLMLRDSGYALDAGQRVQSYIDRRNEES
jgi:hypothetical protein